MKTIRNLLNQKTLSMKMTLKISRVLAAVFAVLLVTFAIMLYVDLEKRELAKLELLAQENANITKDFMETVINKQTSITAALSTINRMDMANKVEFIESLLNTVGKGEDNVLSLFYVAEPNALRAGTPDGFSVFTSAGGVQAQPNRFSYINETIYTKKHLKQKTHTSPTLLRKSLTEKNIKSLPFFSLSSTTKKCHRHDREQS